MKYLTIVAGLILCCAPARAQCGAGGKLIINGITGLPDCTGLTGAGTGTVTSVGESFTGGLISVSGSPVTGAGTLALTVAGTSGGIPYFSGVATWATSAALTAHGVVVGGGAAIAPTSTAAGTAGQVLTSNGSGADPTFQAGGSGTVTSVSVTTANGVSGSVATATTTPAITLTLGAITPTTIVASGAISGLSLATGSSPPTCTAGTGGGECQAEGTAPSVGAAAGVTVTYSDSTQHGWLQSRNNGSYLPIPQGPASTTSGHIASWNSTNGGLLADGGVLGTAAAVSSTCSGTDLTGTLPGCTIVAASVTAAKMVNSGVFTGDVTTTFPAVTVAKVNGIAYSATAAAHSVEVITTANTTATAKVIPDCTDVTGNHINYTQSSDLFSCGTSSSGSGGTGTSITSTTPVTVNTNTTSDQQLMELTMSAGYFNSSKQPFLFNGAGVYTTQTAQTPTITLKIKLCTVSGCGSGTVVTLVSIVSTATIAAVTNNNWNLSILGYTATTGATGNLEIHGPVSVDLGALTTTADSIFNDTNTAVSSNIDLTAALFVDFTVAFSTNAATANTFTQRSSGVMPFAATAAPVTSVFTQTGAIGNLTGDVTTTNTTATTIAASAVTSAKLNITTTTCTAPAVLTAISATATGTCTTPVLTQNSQSTAYTTVLGDAGKTVYHPSGDNNARTFTIDSNANVAYPLETCITFVNRINTVTIAITSDTMTLMGANTTGSRTLAAGNWATACKDGTTSWVIGGSSGLT